MQEPPKTMRANDLSPYERQKVSTLFGVANYDYFVGTGYDAIPTTEFYNGFHMNDESHRSIYEGVDTHRNLPTNAQDLGPYDTSAGLPGFHVWSEARMAMDLAPVIPNQRLFQAGQLGVAMRGLKQASVGERLHGGIRVQELPELQRDKGWPIGVLFGEPTSRAARVQGTINRVE